MLSAFGIGLEITSSSVEGTEVGMEGAEVGVEGVEVGAGEPVRKVVHRCLHSTANGK
jgi:hypothetical protein